MSPILPYRTFSIDSPLSQEEAMQRLGQSVEPARAGIWPHAGQQCKEFEGTVSSAEFQIRRIIHHRNGFRPVLHGHVTPKPEGIQVTVVMKLSPMTILSSLLWLGIMVTVASGALSHTAIMERFTFPSYAPVMMILFFFLIATFSYRVEAVKAGRWLETLLEASETESGYRTGRQGAAGSAADVRNSLPLSTDTTGTP